MVYVPTGAFYVGDIFPCSELYSFVPYMEEDFYQITSENSIAVSSTSGKLWVTDNQRNCDNVDLITSCNIPSSFPKGYQAFYCMKYEISQAHNYLSWEDLCAYLDWAGLRPMTELEYEKACRGPYITDNEYAWGSSEYTEAQTITNAGPVNEGVQESGYGLANFLEGGSAPGGPLRGGFAAGSNTNRKESGASYWGIMELLGMMM
jgi:hypothetical protein